MKYSPKIGVPQQYFLCFVNDYVYFAYQIVNSCHHPTSRIINNYRNSGMTKCLMYIEADMMIFCVPQGYMIYITVIGPDILVSKSKAANSDFCGFGRSRIAVNKNQTLKFCAGYSPWKPTKAFRILVRNRFSSFTSLCLMSYVVIQMRRKVSHACSFM